jgi:hypothetical protein
LDWAAQQQELLRLAGCQLFFAGGAPRSGTTWLQLLLDSHPEVCCRGEGLFQKHLADRSTARWQSGARRSRQRKRSYCATPP